MSHSSNHVVSTWEIVEAQLRRTQFKYKGRTLSDEHSTLVRDCISLWFLSCVDLLRSVGIEDHTFQTRWLNAIASVDVYDLFRSLKKADTLLIGEHLPSYDAFKQHLRPEFPFIGAILAPMKRVFASWFTSEDHDAFSVCHCWLCFPSRLNLPGLAELEAEALRDYLVREDSLKTEGFTVDEGRLISAWYPKTVELDSFFCESFRPRHGNGSTADAGSSMRNKYASLGTDVLLHYLDIRLDGKSLGPRPPRSFERIAKLQFVPKTLLTYRSISMEPATLMWYQQGILSAFVSDLSNRRRHPLRRRFHPSTQQPNRDLAWEGSIDGSFATIDLSAASDSVSWGLVKEWFRDSCLYRWMLCTRSSRVQLPDGKVMVMKKYAPMGSALCFPIECIVFAAITECAIKEAGGDANTSRYCVYGDDIVVESEYAPFVIARLQMNGFEVNTSKSFSGSNGNCFFRESCGGEYLDGVDVTPTRLSRWFSGLHVDIFHPGHILSLVELANDCNSRLPSVRRRCIHALASLPKRARVVFNTTGEGGLFSVQPTNWHLLPPEWSQDYQRWERSIGYFRPRPPLRCLGDEDIRLFEYLRQTHGRQRLLYPEDRVVVDVAPNRAGKWTCKRSPVEEP